jgi:hypothetical protein
MFKAIIMTFVMLFVGLVTTPINIIYDKIQAIISSFGK